MAVHIPKLDALAIGWPITRLGVYLYPLYLARNDLPEIKTGADSGVEVSELDSPSVQALRMRNPGQTPVLVVAGEHIIGAKQNRNVNVSVLVGAGADLKVPVTCLERGRWGAARETARHEAFTPASVRREHNVHLANSMQASGSRAGDQHAVWQEVDSMLLRSQVASDTDEAAAVYSPPPGRDSKSIHAMKELAQRGPLPGQLGVLVTFGHWVVGMDLFGAPSLLGAHWGAIIRSYLVEPPVESDPGYPSVTRAMQLIRRFALADAVESPGVGLGTEYHVRDKLVVGHALTLDNALVHASFFTPLRVYGRPDRPAPLPGTVR